VTSHYEGFPGQSKVWSKKPPLADGVQMGSESARRKRGQFRNDCHALAFERRAPGKVAGQRCGERFSAGEDGACSGRVPRLLASPVPCERLTPAASHGCFAGRLGRYPCALRQRSERRRAFSRRSASVILQFSGVGLACARITTCAPRRPSFPSLKSKARKRVRLLLRWGGPVKT
jgi:hypothetical protein